MTERCSDSISCWDRFLLGASFFILALSLSGIRERVERIEKAVAPVTTAVEAR